MEKLATEVQIQAPFITLGQLLKEESIIATGGQAKWFLRENTVLVNEEPDDRRGRKLYPGDIIAVPSGERFVINGTGASATNGTNVVKLNTFEIMKH